jgi:putative thioredoxin
MDGTDAGFMTDVIDASQTQPVVVQFTAPWCGPCRTLGPQLEAAIQKTGGKMKLVRINIDENPQIAGQLQVQSIPAVFGFAGGQPIDGFMGAQSPSQIDAFLQKLMQAGGGAGGEDQQIDAMLDAADEAVGQGGAGEAAQVYAQILGVKPENLRAIAGLARCYAASGDFDRARETLAMAPEDKADDPLVAQVRSMIELSESTGSAGDAAPLAAAVAANPDDHQARMDYALALIGGGQNEEAIDELLTLFQRDSEWNEGAAREQLFKLFEALGPTDPLTLKGRRRLSSLMFA